jgi:hypothetical protein
MKKIILLLPIQLFLVVSLVAQSASVKLIKDKSNPAIHVTIGGKPFTDFFFPDTIAKQVLYPISAPNGTVITRGFPMNTKPGDPTDHPHHLGLWLNYESVNGLDFWNNSFAIPAEKKHLYGTIKFGKITEMKDGKVGRLGYESSWQDHAAKTLLNENTRYDFSEVDGSWVIDRTTTLTAVIPVLFKDVKDGFLGLRMAHELQIPTKETKKFVDASGIETVIKAVVDSIPNGNYVNSNGVQGEDVWSKKATWCMMYGKMGKDSISIVIIDHPKNTGYPTNWHARGYGLFAANPLGEKVFTNGQHELNLSLKPGESVTFKYRVVISSGVKVLDKVRISAIEKQFYTQQ